MLQQGAAQATGLEQNGKQAEASAVLEQLDATTVVEPGNHVEVDPLGAFPAGVTSLQCAVVVTGDPPKYRPGGTRGTFR